MLRLASDAGCTHRFHLPKNIPWKRGFLWTCAICSLSITCWRTSIAERNINLIEILLNHLFQDGFMEGWINHDKPMISWDELPTTIDYEGLLHPPKAIGDGLVQAMGSQWCCGLVGPGPVIFNQPKSTTHWLTPSFSTKVGISPTSKHVVSFLYKYIYISNINPKSSPTNSEFWYPTRIQWITQESVGSTIWWTYLSIR